MDSSIIQNHPDFQAMIQQSGARPALDGFDQTQALLSLPKPPTGPALDIISMDKVAPKAVQWLWPDRIALGKLTLLMGDPGTGKSILTTGMAANVTTGRGWPDGTACPAGDVFIISAEDDPADTIRPRLDAAGADVQRVHCVRGVLSKNQRAGFQITDLNLDLLDEELTNKDSVRLVIIDPISAYLCGTDSYINAEVRQALDPLARLAGKHNIAIIAVTHMNKTGGGQAMYRAMGSLAFVAAARGSFLVTRDRDAPDRRLFLPVKNNIAPDKDGLAFHINQVGTAGPAITWESGPVELTADDALQALATPRLTALNRAEDWLEQAMDGKAASANEIIAKAAESNISKSALTRAREALGIRSEKVGDGWLWHPKAAPPSDLDGEILTP